MESVLDPMGMCGARGVRLDPDGMGMGMGMCGAGGVELNSTGAGLCDTGRALFHGIFWNSFLQKNGFILKEILESYGKANM